VPRCETTADSLVTFFSICIAGPHFKDTPKVKVCRTCTSYIKSALV
jgi:hypothetical protein